MTLPRRRLLAALLLLTLAGPSGVGQPAPAGSPLTSRQTAGMKAVLEQARGMRLGLLVADADSGQTLFTRQPDALYVPASNMKLLSLGAALYRLGPDYWFSTSVTRLPGPDARHADHLTLVGSGDPSLEASAGEHSLAGLARQVYAGGLRSVGDLHLDAHLIGGPAGQQEAGWTVPVVERPVSALTLNDPSVGDGAELTTTPDTRAALLGLGRRFRTELEQAGVRVGGRILIVAGPGGSAVPGPPEEGVATTRSGPLSDLARSALKRSDNVWSEQLYARLGVDTGTPVWRPASNRQARSQELALLGRAGSDDTRLVLRDGSGLSADNRLSPRALVDLLRYVYLHPVGVRLAPGAAYRQRRNLLIEALPRAGTGTDTSADAQLGGTLATRLRGLDVRAKTGTLPGVSALSGYLTTRGGRVLIFSILMDGYGGPGQDLRRLQDALLEALAGDR